MDTVTCEQCIKPQFMALWPQLKYKETTLPACAAGPSTGVPALGLAMPGPDGQLIASALIQRRWLHRPATGWWAGDYQSKNFD